MLLDQLASIGEVVAAIAVVVSLIYVARQIGQNTNALQSNTEAMWSSINQSVVMPLATDRDGAKWWIAGTSDFDSLDEIDKQRHLLFEYNVLTAWWSIYLARKKGLVSDDQWGNNIRTMEMFGKRQAIREAWKSYKPLYNAEFQRLLSEYLE